MICIALGIGYRIDGSTLFVPGQVNDDQITGIAGSGKIEIDRTGCAGISLEIGLFKNGLSDGRRGKTNGYYKGVKVFHTRWLEFRIIYKGNPCTIGKSLRNKGLFLDSFPKRESRK